MQCLRQRARSKFSWITKKRHGKKKKHGRRYDVYAGGEWGAGKNGPGKNGPGKNGPEKTVRRKKWSFR